MSYCLGSSFVSGSQAQCIHVSAADLSVHILMAALLNELSLEESDEKQMLWLQHKKNKDD